MDTGFSLSLVGVSQFPLVLQATHTYVQFPPCISKARKLNEDILPEEDGGGGLIERGGYSETKRVLGWSLWDPEAEKPPPRVEIPFSQL